MAQFHSLDPVKSALLERRHQRVLAAPLVAVMMIAMNRASCAPDDATALYARGWMAGNIGHGACDSRVLLDLNRVHKTMKDPTPNRPGSITMTIGGEISIQFYGAAD